VADHPDAAPRESPRLHRPRDPLLPLARIFAFLGLASVMLL
jgi:hypothetical protein